MVLENVNAVVSNFTEVYYKLDSIIFNTTLAEKDREDQIGRLGETFSREVRALLFIARHYRPEDNYSIFEPEESSSFGGPVQKEIVMENVKAVASNITEVHNKLENILTNTKLNSKEKESQIQRLSEIFPREVRVLYFIARHYRPEDTTPVYEMTVLQPFHIAMNNLDGLIKDKSVKIMNYYPDNFSELEKNEEQTFKMAWDSKLMQNAILGALFSGMVAKQFKNTVIKMLRDEKLHKELSSYNFDAVLVETFEISGFYLTESLQIPAIAVLSAVRYPVFDELFGQSSTLGYIPATGSSLPPKAGFFSRLSTTLNANPYLNFAVARPGNVVQIGGITMLKKGTLKKIELPEEYEKILNERESTVFISFGSVVRAYEMPENFKKGILKMFELLPDVTFIFKYEDELEEDMNSRIPKNVYLKKWVPQPALLLDDRLKVFVTHGGLGSTMEVAHSGKLALMVPLFAGQFENAQILARHGGAVDYNKFDLANGKKCTQEKKKYSRK
ncbi:hypothetical protein L5515_006177 [Caenorhabditis briggsae]|uniref:glucuronosyltransferase n=1 Tax=Caenorhabditis briggsae TaxID=6238 RepID=A0AAE9EZY8_CAEBR|nr:hypothetical protein L5515_006177 [Caenorhabditis briggsae]